MCGHWACLYSYTLKNSVAQILSKFTKTQPQKSKSKKPSHGFMRDLGFGKERDAALKRFLRSKHKTDLWTFKSLINKVIMEINKQAKGNSKMIWKCIDKWSAQATTMDHLVVANIFTNYFISSLSELCNSNSELPSTSFTASVGTGCVSTGSPYQPISIQADDMDLCCMSEYKVYKITSSLSNSKVKDSWGLIKFS